MKKIIISIFSLALLASCSKEQETDKVDNKVVEVTFDMGTRAVLPGGEQVDKDTYTLIAYPPAGLTQNIRMKGYYQYNKSLAALTPIARQGHPSYGVGSADYLQHNSDGGMQLEAPSNGTDRKYHISVVYPAVPVEFVGGLGVMAIFERTEDVYTSNPYDYLGDATNLPFVINVTQDKNFHIYKFPDNGSGQGVKLHPMQAAIRVYFYGSGFEIKDQKVELYNAGPYGFYNPATKKGYPSSSSTTLDLTGFKAEEIGLQTPGGTITNGDGTHNIRYLLGRGEGDGEGKEIQIFPNDYKTGFSSAYMSVPVLKTVTIIEGKEGNVEIPLELDFKPRKRYTFFVNVDSGVFDIKYSISEWGNDISSDGTIGGELIDYKKITLSEDAGEWTDKDNDNGSIGK